MTTHRHFDEELEKLHALLTQMFDLVVDQLDHAIQAIVTGDEALARRVRHRDEEVDALELAIDRQCEVLVVTQQPVAVDMRMVVTAIKVNTDLERIGDLSSNLAKYVPHLCALPGFVHAQAHTEELAQRARAILDKTRRAFLAKDHDAAHSILPLDEDVDRLYKDALQKIILLGEVHPEYMAGLLYLVNLTKALERICDHAMNIAEAVVFQVEGVDIRHQRIQQGFSLN